MVFTWPHKWHDYVIYTKSQVWDVLLAYMFFTYIHTCIHAYIYTSCRTLLLIQNRLREEHSLQDVLFKNVMRGAPTALPPRSVLFSSQSVFLTRSSCSIKCENKHSFWKLRRLVLWGARHWCPVAFSSSERTVPFSLSTHAGYTDTSTLTKWLETSTSPSASMRFPRHRPSPVIQLVVTPQ